MLELSTLADRREELKSPDSFLAHLMPAKRELSLINYLRHARLYELPKTRNARYAKSFIPYPLVFSILHKTPNATILFRPTIFHFIIVY